MSHDFYKNLAPVYHLVFPVDGKDELLVKCFEGAQRLLDVGCSDGRVAKAVAQKIEGVTIDAIDLSRDLVQIAKGVVENSTVFDSIRVKEMDMMDINQMYQPDTFDGVYCIGNTLVHLNDEQEIKVCLSGFYHVMKPNGTLVVQILNYDVVLDEQMQMLPTIENDSIQFERRYTHGGSHIDFISHLTLKNKDDLKLSASTKLFPIRTESLVTLLKQQGFTDVTCYSGYKFDVFDPQKLTFIVTAKKMEKIK